jgi:DsbC/DsbD-like thiol-disulfide interchange protein
MSLVHRIAIAASALLFAGAAHAHAVEEPPLASPWVPADNARARLVAGRLDGPDRQARLFAGIEVELAEGWKTYWRNPGSSGVPPRLDATGSSNLADAVLIFPAPIRFPDRDGDTIGYKHRVTFPVLIAPRDRIKPIELKLALELGICKDICIPAEIKLELSLPPDVAPAAAGSQLAAAVARVPRAAAARLPGDPSVKSIKADLAGLSPRITVEAVFPGGTKGADLFAEAPDGLWVALPRKTGESGGDTVGFEIDLTDGADVAELKGKSLRLTLVGEGGASEASVRLE